jgi:hypothetical protein
LVDRHLAAFSISPKSFEDQLFQLHYAPQRQLLVGCYRKDRGVAKEWISKSI